VRKNNRTIMGLTIRYTLAAKGTLTDDDIRKMARRTARLAQKIGCARVGKVLPAWENDPEAPDFFQTRWCDRRRLVGGCGTRGWLVEVWPGEGCETAVFGLLRERRQVPGQFGGRPPRRNARWQLRDCCKTCYAARHGTEHFIRCHKRIVQLLDFWRKMGAEVEVYDEGYFWKSRSEQLLGEQVRGLQDYLLRMDGKPTAAIERQSADAPKRRHRHRPANRRAGL
jgi:hypothetical protein